MKSPFLRLALSLALLAVFGYAAFSLLPLLGKSETAIVCVRTVEDTVPIYGVFLREESVLPTDEDFPLVEEGQRFPAGTLGEKSGIYTAHVDGFEHLTSPALTTRAIYDLCLDRRMALSSPGKLITGSSFRFYALMESDDARRLSLGRSCLLESDRFGGIELRLAEIGESADGFTALLFEGSKNMDTVKYLRQVSGRLLLGSYTGFYIPDEAVYSEGDELFVLSKSLGETENIPIAVVYDGDGFKIAKSPLLFEGSALIINSGGN